MKYDAADAVGLLRRLALGVRRQECVTVHRRRFVHEEGGLQPAALSARERARRAGVEHRDADIGRDLIEPIAEGAVRKAVLGQQQALFVGVARVVEDHFQAAAAAGRHRPTRLGHARRELIEGDEQVAQLWLLQHRGIGGRHTAQVHQHRGDPLRIRDAVLQERTVRSSVVRPDREHEALQRPGGTGAVRREHESGREDRERDPRSHGLPSLRNNTLACSNSGATTRAEGPAAPAAAAARRAASRMAATSNGVCPVIR